MGKQQTSRDGPFTGYLDSEGGATFVDNTGGSMGEFDSPLKIERSDRFAVPRPDFGDKDFVEDTDRKTGQFRKGGGSFPKDPIPSKSKSDVKG